VEQVQKAGSATFTLRLDRAQATMADRLELTLETVTPEDAEVTFPEVGSKLGKFRVQRRDGPAPLLLSGKRMLQARLYALDPSAPEEHVIPPLEVKVVAEGQTKTLTTQAISVPVASTQPKSMNDIAGPDAPPPNRGWIGWIIALLLLLAGGCYWWMHRRRPAPFVAPPLPAHELAWKQLQELVDEDLPGKGEIKLYYQRLSSILRHYIENRFGLHVPGQTTEEFLRHLQRGDSLMQNHRDLLRDFLQHCDLVKFAEHQPSRSDMETVLESCREFIRQTKVSPLPSSTPAAA